MTITHAAHVLKLPKKIVMRNSAHHNNQHVAQLNDDPILDYIFNTLGGPKPVFPNVQTSTGQIKASYDVPQSRTIIYAPPVILKQPIHETKQVENLMEDALNSLLLDGTNDLAADRSDFMCPSHKKTSSGSGSTIGNEVANIEDNNDANVIQFCSCHFIKRLKEKQ